MPPTCPASCVFSIGGDAMRIFAVLLAVGLALASVSPVYAGSTGSESQQSGQIGTEPPGMLVLARAGAERLIRRAPVGLTDAQVYGIAAGIVAAAIVGDLAGLNGAGITALAAIGGALGNWLLSGPIAEAALTADEPDGGPHSTPPTPAR
jgi:hypothetical protein